MQALKPFNFKIHILGRHSPIILKLDKVEEISN